MVDPVDVQAALSDETCLVSVMHSNNEVGAMQPISQIVQLARQKDILIHSDAAQSIGKVCTPSACGHRHDGVSQANALCHVVYHMR